MGKIIINNKSKMSDELALKTLAFAYKEMMEKFHNRKFETYILQWDKYVVKVRKNIESITFAIYDFKKGEENA